MIGDSQFFRYPYIFACSETRTIFREFGPPPPPGPKSLDVQYSRRTQFPRNFGPGGTEFPREVGPPDRKLGGDRFPCDTGSLFQLMNFISMTACS